MSVTTSLKSAGVMGWPIAHSLSPRLHGYWLAKHGISGSYDAVPVEAAQLETALRSLKDNGWRGVNLTVPHKEAAARLVDSLDSAAHRIGAVNLVVVGAAGVLEGRNTDAYGFTQNLIMAGFEPLGGTAMMLGAGGAARAVLVALIDMGFSEIRIANRGRSRAEALALQCAAPSCKITVLDWPQAAETLEDVSLLVNATSLGMKGQPELEFSLDSLPLQAWVCDIVYAPLETGLLRRARARGNQIVDGLGMLLHQARPSFQAFFGIDPEVTDELRRHVLEGRS